MDVAHQRQPVHLPRHVHIREHQPHICGMGRHKGNRLVRMRRFQHAEPGIRQDVGHERAYKELVLYQDDHGRLRYWVVT